MSISAVTPKAWDEFLPEEQDRIIRMAWEDRTTFETIFAQFGLTANEVVKFMRTQLGAKAFIRWRKRASVQGRMKHSKHVHHQENRFKCSRQRLDGSTKGWK